MRVLHLIDDLEPGDAAAYVAEHVRLAGPGVESQVWSLAAHGALPETAGAAARPLRARLVARGRRWLDASLDWARLASALREERIPVVHAHGARVARRAAAVTAWARVRVLVAGVYRAPGGLDGEGGFDGWTVRRAARLLCVCDHVRRGHAVRFPGAADRFVTVLGGVSSATPARLRAAARSALGLDERHRVVLMSDGTRPEAGQQVALEAFARLWRRLPSARLVIPMARGPRSAAFERRIAELELTNEVRWTGPPIADYLEAADVVLLPALRAGLPPELLQAMSAGCPVVATRVGGIPEAVADGETGWLVPPGEPLPAAEALLHVLADPARTRAFSAAARDRAAREFEGARMVAETERHYRAALATSRAAAAARAREATAHGG